MLGFRQLCLVLALGAGQTTAILAQAESPQAAWGLQTAIGVGGGDKLGFAGTAAVGPRYRGNLFSVRGTWGVGAEDSAGTKHSVWELGLTYGRQFCSPGACYGFALGPGIIDQTAPDEKTQVMERQRSGALLWQVSLHGVLSPTSSIGLTFLGNRNAVQNFWGLFLVAQFGMPWHSRDSGEEE